MSVRDLGYRAYEGTRLPASNNTRVLLRHGLRRAWGSWLVKITAFLGWLPPVCFMAVVGVQFWLRQQAPGQVQELDASAAGTLVNQLVYTQLWLFVTMVTLGAGACAISEDFTFKAFQFYFSKPVTRVQYLLGRTGAVAIWGFSITFIPALLLIMVLLGVVQEDNRLETLGLVLPALLDSLLIAVVCASASMGMSSLSKSRALTMSAWMLLFVVPHILGTIVHAVGDWPWLKLASLPALLEVMGDSLFKVAREDEMTWYHALPVLLVVALGGLALSMERLRKAEVIS